MNVSDDNISLITRLAHALKDNPSAAISVTRAGTGTLALLAVKLLELRRPVAFIVHDREEMQSIRGLVSLFTPALSAGEAPSSKLGFGEWLCIPPCPPRSACRSGWADKLAALYALRHGAEYPSDAGLPSIKEVRGVIMTADNLLLRLPPLRFFDNRTLIITKGMDISPELLIEQAVEWGYERVPMVSNPGEIARRGDIIDMMLPGMDSPIRLDFFGDTVDDIRLFDSNTQRSVGSITQATILPVHPIAFDGLAAASMHTLWEQQFQNGSLTENEYSGAKHLAESHSFSLMPGIAYHDAVHIEDWFPKDIIYLIPSENESTEALVTAEEMWRIAMTEDAAFRDTPPRKAVRQAADSAVWLRSPHLKLDLLRIESHTGIPDLPERRLDSFQSLFPAAEQRDRPWQTLTAALDTWKKEKKTVILSFASARNRDKFLKLAAQEQITLQLRYIPDTPSIYALVGSFRGGSDISWNNMLVLGEEVIQPNAGKSRRTPTGIFKGLDRCDTLKPDELLVHRDYGIARFGGLVRIGTDNTANDYLLLYYAGDDKLYVPVDRLSLIQRYKGGSETAPAPDRLGGAQWQIGKEKARKAIEKIAADLVEIYAWRKVAKGFRYNPVDEVYHEFEASFGFEETPDQTQAIRDMLADMDKPEPMDRLICGDVGFGKTEVALRAAFRAASEGRQVALLCPTTVLAEQHYRTFKSRLLPFAVNVGLLSRFVSQAKQKEVLKMAADGRIDVLIGTHRLLSDDVILPNLGLLILDEEQRFGVRHKEKLKKMKKSVDALTLSATPIPRTLQLSISGVRDLSVIETAPPERKPVATAIIERDDAALRSILARELDRQGQVFWIHNRVQGIEHVAEYVQKLAPDARIGLAHGKLPEKTLEETMHKFWHGELDILICTAIVESGLDFPRANTLIVDQPQLFGLGQLYQLRGRVGRSDIQAFAVFVVSDLKHLSQAVRERLRIILDMDYLGAGFQVAMEDLRLRGAGNILGEAQSGQMGRVGIELYLEMLEEAVARLKGEESRLTEETEINLGIPAHIPESYINDGSERLRWYRRLSAAQDTAARHETELELLDRYGKLPEELNSFIAMLELKDFLKTTQAVRADLFADRIRITWHEKQRAFPVENLIAFLTKHRKTTQFLPPTAMECKLDTGLAMPERLHAIRRDLLSLLDGTQN